MGNDVSVRTGRGNVDRRWARADLRCGEVEKNGGSEFRRKSV